MSFIPTGVDLERFKPRTFVSGSQTATFVGRVEKSSRWKGIDQLVKAMQIVVEKFPEAKLEIVGGGDAVDEYRELAKKLGLEKTVAMMGPKTGEDLVDAYRRSSVVVLPSVTDAEAFSLVLIEAMAMGCPVIGTNIGGTPQVIDNGVNGLLVPAKDPTALAKAITDIFSDGELACRIGEGGALKVRSFGWEARATEYFNLFNKLIEKK